MSEVSVRPNSRSRHCRTWRWDRCSDPAMLPPTNQTERELAERVRRSLRDRAVAVRVQRERQPNSPDVVARTTPITTTLRSASSRVVGDAAATGWTVNGMLSSTAGNKQALKGEGLCPPVRPTRCTRRPMGLRDRVPDDVESKARGRQHEAQRHDCFPQKPSTTSTSR